MKPEEEQEYCDVCDHRIVGGVACDGFPRECLHQYPAVKPAQAECPHFEDVMDSFLGEDEFDAIRGLD